MTDTTADEVELEKKPGKKSLVIGLVLALAGSGAGYFATASGTIRLGAHPVESDTEAGVSYGAQLPDQLPDIAFVDLQPIMVSLLRENGQRHLRFHAQLEVPEHYLADVEKIRPRIVDVLNGYLRAVEIDDLSDPLALTRLRGHMQRRINIVAGEGRVNDVLVMEFVLN
ncbi:flagellar basal body-associated FliL family protein [Ruegeria pomeroyi]|uniref:Flagellar protein FliL n=1 Tax=Ruegeria alba TaxID=2916756 RepID=A0ABS9P0S3_9RHOB|nr:flagellar basal body-associated FliL family protein [Ruegeria alba]MCE8513833.1 flagellar basal body-associated FliL family protein [Ruegeria pomeroyi]MCE8522892.1 flagellar basal body-associated FliL family protein [Ruegeria pomeroyi]MCE8526944.1 flagellar basal body-associated FliL family protein [Ruegeria pomeroyi]MCE8530569.1 flagellar basal body-associated FliL family protein [Ruegeria pomeroyi]MCE8535139.1 flagellar basal body-associated FliL family protein [Ruegeria pomeroyi]